MRVALYLRKSTDEHQRESIETQRENATRWAVHKGWTVVAEFVDSGISRTDFSPARRRGWFAMQAAAKRGDFDAVVVRDVSRIGGDVFDVGIFVRNLIATGVRLHCYADGREVTATNALDCIGLALQSFGSQNEVEHLRKRTREALETRARRGLMAGGRCYGYTNVRGADGVTLTINEAEAEIVREIFRRYAAGEGLRTIGHDLNARGVQSPRGGKNTGSWAPSCIHAMLRRERYIGQLTWGATHRPHTRDGSRVRVRAPKTGCEVVAVEAPHLRIVDDATWQAVQERTTRYAKISATGTRDRRRASYLLSGLARCAECGGPLAVETMRIGGGKRVKAYGCGWHRDRGASVCAVSLRRPVESVDRHVVEAIRRDVLTERVVLSVCREVRRRLEERKGTGGAELAALEGESRKLRAEIDKLGVALLASDSKPDVIVRMLDERQHRLRDVDARLRTAKAAPAAIDLEIRRQEKRARERLTELHGALGRHPLEARRTLERLLSAPLTFAPVHTPAGQRYELTGAIGAAALAGAEGTDGSGYVRATFEDRTLPDREFRALG